MCTTEGGGRLSPYCGQGISLVSGRKGGREGGGRRRDRGGGRREKEGAGVPSRHVTSRHVSFVTPATCYGRAWRNYTLPGEGGTWWELGRRRLVRDWDFSPPSFLPYSAPDRKAMSWASSDDENREGVRLLRDASSTAAICGRTGYCVLLRVKGPGWRRRRQPRPSPSLLACQLARDGGRGCRGLLLLPLSHTTDVGGPCRAVSSQD